MLDRIYATKPEYRGQPPVDSVSVRWELYRVEHGDHASLWKVALDPKGRPWAIKRQRFHRAK